MASNETNPAGPETPAVPVPENQADLLKLLTALSTRFINLAFEEIDEGIFQALQILGDFNRVDRSYVFLYSDDKLKMSCAYEWCAAGIEPQIQRMQDLRVVDLRWSNKILLRGETLHVPSLDDLPHEAQAEKDEFRRQGIQSLIAVPMVYRGEVTGFLGFDAVRAEKNWSSQSTALLNIAGEMFVNAIEHKRAQAIQAGQRQFLELLASGGSFSDTLNALVRVIEEQSPGALGLILLLDEDGRHLHVGASASLPEAYLDSIEGLEIGPRVGSCGTACYTRRQVVVEDIAADPRWEGLRDLALKHGLRACWSDPVLAEDGCVLGTFAIYYRYPRRPSQAELRTIETAAHLVGVAVEHKRAREALQLAYQTMEQRVAGRTRELAMLLEVQQGISSELDTGEVMQMIADGARQLTGSQFAGLFLLEGEEMRLAVLSTAGDRFRSLSPGYTLPLAGSAAGLAVRSGEPVLVRDARRDPRIFHDLIEQTGISSFLIVPLMSAGQPAGALTVADKLVGKLGPEDERVLTLLASSAVIALDNARLYLNEQQRRQAAEGLRDILAVLNSDRQLGEVLNHIALHARQLLEASATMIRHLDSNRGIVTTEASCSLPPEFEVIRSMPYYRTPRDDRLLAHQPIVSEDVQAYLQKLKTEPGMLVGAKQWEWVELILRFYRSQLVVPLFVKGELYGTLTFYYASQRQFSEESIQLAAALGDQTALAIENARLRSQAEKTAAALERSRLARDLHDAVTQTLFSASLIAEVLPRLWEKNEAEGRRRLEELRQLTRGALAEMRTLLLELRPSALIEADPAELLRHLVEAFTGRARIPVRSSIQGQPAMPPEVKVAFYRIVQEALNNTAKHSGASRVDLSLDCRPEAVELCIADDGRGFDPAEISAENLGIGIMKERAENIGARIAITSRPGQGTRIEVVWKGSHK